MAFRFLLLALIPATIVGDRPSSSRIALSVNKHGASHRDKARHHQDLTDVKRSETAHHIEEEVVAKTVPQEDLKSSAEALPHHGHHKLVPPFTHRHTANDLMELQGTQMDAKQLGHAETSLQSILEDFLGAPTFEEIDKDKSGKIDKKEWEAAGCKDFEKIDKDKSGEIDKKEFEEAKDLIEKACAKGGGEKKPSGCANVHVRMSLVLTVIPFVLGYASPRIDM